MTAPLPHYTDAELDAVLARVSLKALVERRVRLQRAGAAAWKGLCPFHEEKTPSFVVREERNTYKCYGCGASGNAFRWLMETEGLGFREAVGRLSDGWASPVSSAPVAQRASVRVGRRGRPDPVDSAVVGRWVWQTAVSARGTIVEAWLAARGLDPAGVPGAIDRLRFHPAAPIVSWLEGQGPEHIAARGLTAPAMVAPIADPRGRVWGVHCTYLAPDGGAKATLPLAWDGEARDTRKIFGRAARLAVWLTPPAAEAGRPAGPLIVGEGIETSWSYAQHFGGGFRLAAALSLNNLQGGQILLRDGSMPLWKPRADPGRPPFLVEQPGETIVLVDADMKPLRDQKVQLARGAKPVRADISSLQRSELCAELAVQAWRRAGAIRPRAVRPPMGMDFNDAARAGLLGRRRAA